MAKNNKQTAGQDGVSKMVALGSKKFIAQQLNYARTSPVIHAHNSCCAIAQQLLGDCRRYLFQQLILSFPTTYPIYPKDLCNILQAPLPYIPTFSPISLRFLKRFCRFIIVDSSVIYDF